MMKLLTALVLLTMPLKLVGQETIFELDKKPYKMSDLTPAAQQQVFEVENERVERVKQIVENQLFENYVADEVKKSGKSREDVMKKMLDVAAVKEKDMKDWYEANKARVPYPFEQIKGEVQKLLENERREAKRKEVVEKVKSKQKYNFMLKKPDAPVVQLNVEGFFAKGAKDAKVTIVEFADYQCPHCKATSAPLKKAVDEHKDKVKLVFIDFPINPSGISKIVAQGAYCAGQKNKFWEFHEAAFAKAPGLDKETPAKIAKDLGLNETEFKACLESKPALDFVAKSKEEGDRVGVSGTPFIFVNGKRYLAGHSYDDFKKAIKENL